MATQKIVFTLFLVILMASLSNLGLAASQDFTIINDTGLDIFELYISPYQLEDWQKEILEGEIFADGDKLNITFEEARPETYWDIKVKDEDGNILLWHKINLKEASLITLCYDGNEVSAETE